MKEILDIIHKTIYQFFDVCEDDEEVPMSDKDKLLLEVNKAICNNLKALEQPCEDCISRQAAIDAITHELRCGSVMDQCGLETAYDIINELPPVTPQPKIGHWIVTMEGNGYRFQCSVCKKLFLYNSDTRNFCGNCGAKMEGIDR